MAAVGSGSNGVTAEVAPGTAESVESDGPGPPDATLGPPLHPPAETATRPVASATAATRAQTGIRPCTRPRPRTRTRTRTRTHPKPLIRFLSTTPGKSEKVRDRRNVAARYPTQVPGRVATRWPAPTGAQDALVSVSARNCAACRTSRSRSRSAV